MSEVFHLPYFGRATAKKKQENPDMFLWCTYPYEVRNIQRVRASEVDTVLSGASMTAPDRHTARSTRHVFPTIVHHNGKLYRELDPAEKTVFSRWYSPHDLQPVNPLTFPIERRHAWIMGLFGWNTERNRLFWPGTDKLPQLNDHWQSRSRDLLILRQDKTLGPPFNCSVELNEHDFNENMLDFKAQTDRLIKIGSKLWIETPLPSVSIRTEIDHGRKYAGICLDFLPTSPSHSISRQHFPLSMLGEVREIMDIFLNGEDGGKDCLDIDLNGADPSIFDFDHEYRNANETSMSVAACVVRRVAQFEFHDIHQGKGHPFPDAEDEISALQQKLESLNYVTGVFPDFTGDYALSKEIWDSFGRKRYPGLVDISDEMLINTEKWIFLRDLRKSDDYCRSSDFRG